MTKTYTIEFVRSDLPTITINLSPVGLRLLISQMRAPVASITTVKQ